MPMWRCPHCGTPQAETARCWVCRRSSTTCGTCRNFRQSVAGTLGYCGLDRRRQPLAGDEIRPCWDAWPGAVEAIALAPMTIPPAASSELPRGPIEFVEVQGPVIDEAPTATGEVAALPPRPATLLPADEPGWSLWGDLDR
jgi:hypothetical protein